MTIESQADAAAHDPSDLGVVGSPPVWRKSCHADNGCVEVAQLDTATLAIRDSTRADGPVITLGAKAFEGFLDRIKGGEG